MGTPARLGDGFFHFTILSSPGQVLRVDATTNLANWVTLATVTNTTGTMDFADMNSPGFSNRFYRVLIPGVAPVTLTLTQPTRLPGGQFQFIVAGSTGIVFRLQANADLSQTNWTTLATLTKSAGVTPFTDNTTTNAVQRFYHGVSP